MALFNSLGLNENPFSRFSAEEETPYLRHIYLNPKYYSSLLSDLKQGSSRFIIGSRGSGKTALIQQLQEELQQEALVVAFDNFDGIPTKDNGKELLFAVVQKSVTQFSVALSQDPSKLTRLDTFDKERLAFFIEGFFKTLSRKEYEESVNSITKFKTVNFYKRVWNNFLNKPINFFISGGVELVSDMVSKSLGLNPANTAPFYKEYLPTATISSPSGIASVGEYDYAGLKDVLNDLAKIVRKSGFKNLVIFFDKIDEYKALSGTINDVSLFVEAVARDTSLLMNTEFSLVLSIWDEVKDDLNSRGVRFDKFKPIDVTWNDDELLMILDKRIGYFSGGRKRTIEILAKPDEAGEIVHLANKSPRDLLHIFSSIYYEQDTQDSTATAFSEKSIHEGKLKFCINYDFYSLFPSKAGARENVTRNINRLLRIGKPIIKTTDLVNTFKVHTNTAISYVKSLKDYNFIAEMTEKDGNAPLYQISDPKVKYLIENKIPEI